jgi:hypothetical protein
MLVVIVIVGVALLVAIAETRGRGGALDQQKYRESWLKLENNLDKNNASTYQFAVLAADKLLDQALKESGIAGATMGERLKNSSAKFSRDLLNQIWAAHKLRNQIAHEADSKVNILGARRTLSTFKKALKDLGAI